MKFCKNIKAVTVAFSAAFMALFAGCSDSHVAGNSAETGSPELAGIFVLDNGSPAAHARVQCVPSDFNIISADRAERSLPQAFETETDENGNYEFDSIPSGRFSIEAFHEESGQMFLKQNLANEQGETLAINDTLRHSGSVKLLVPGAFRENQGGDAIVVGTTIHRRISVQNGKIEVDSLPADSFDIVIYMDKLFPVKFENVSVQPDETTVWGDSVTYSFTAPLALPERENPKAENSASGDSVRVVTDIPLALVLDSSVCDLDSLDHLVGRWEAFRISHSAAKKQLPIAEPQLQNGKMMFWVRLDSLNTADEIELTFNTAKDPAYAFDVFPTNRSYSLVYHFDSGLSLLEDSAEKGYFEGSAETATELDSSGGVLGNGMHLGADDVVTVKNSAGKDSTRKVNLTFDDDGYFCFSLWLQLESLDKEQLIFKKAEEYALRYVPKQGFVVDFYHEAMQSVAEDVSKTAEDSSYKISWVSGADGINAGEWVYVAFSRRAFEQVLFYVNNRQIISEAEKSDWARNVKERANFQLGGFTGNIDELSIGACFHDESWTLTTYLNQHPENRWPSLSAR